MDKQTLVNLHESIRFECMAVREVIFKGENLKRIDEDQLKEMKFELNGMYRVLDIIEKQIENII